MTDTSAKGKVSTVKQFMEQAKVNVRPQTTATQQTEQKTEERFAQIQSNPFYKALLNPEFSPEQKKAEVATALTFTGDKAQDKVRLEEFVRFKEYLQVQRKRMAQEIIALTDTEAFSELQGVYQEINSALHDFEKSIAPLTEIVDAVYTLRMNGVTFDAFREIVRDKEDEERRKKERAAMDSKLDSLEAEMNLLRDQNSKLAKQRSYFGFSPITEEARNEIAKNDAALIEKRAELEAVTTSIEEFNRQTPPESELEAFANEKSKLRELLDISSDEHKQRQQALVASAQDFINKTESRVSGVLGHFSGMNGQIDRLSEANYTMREMYAILNDATKGALDQNQQQRETLLQETNGDGDIQKMQRERTQRDLENYITALGQSHVDTTAVFADLTSSGHRIKSMKDGNSQQIAKTRAIHTSGVAGVADQLSTVLQAVSAAALGESSEMARMSLERMNQTTQDLSQKEVLRVALGTKEVNTELSKALSDLEQYGEVIRTATGITRSGLEETKRLLTDLEQTARTVHEDVRESIGVAADVAAGKGGTRTGAPAEEEPAKDPLPNPFNFGS